MNDNQGKGEGYVYILGVKDIELPVCKIGMTRRNPIDRCAEINRSSTGDFLWEVASYVAVNDCQVLESLVHSKLQPLRQRNREFFNISTDVAHTALRSILDSQSQIDEIEIEPQELEERAVLKSPGRKKAKQLPRRDNDLKYANLLHTFTSLTKCKGRPFGQLNKPFFGMSDGNEGVQWNVVISPETQEARLGVNLEGKKYRDWPIATFILSELENPRLNELRENLKEPERVHVRFMRDAWQVTSRPSIEERLIHKAEPTVSMIDASRWQTILDEALGCLNAAKGYCGRGKQVVTLTDQPRTGLKNRLMEVSPHLTIWTPINLAGDDQAELVAGLKRLQPVHEWVTSILMEA